MKWFEVYGYRFEIKDRGGHYARKGMDENELWTEILLQLQDPELLKQFETLEDAKAWCDRVAPRRTWTATQKLMFGRGSVVRGYCLYIEENERDEDMDWLDGGEIYSVYVEPLEGSEKEEE